MKPRSNWLYWAAPAAVMAAFTIIGVLAAMTHAWTITIMAALGVISSAALWSTIQNLRATITALQRARVEDAYKIAALDNDLNRARRWNS